MATLTFWKHVFLLYTVTFFVVLPLLCHQLEYSIYFQLLFDPKDNVKYEARIQKMNATNEHRVEQSLQFLKALKADLSSEPNTLWEKGPWINTARALSNRKRSDKGLFVAITIITASRKHPEEFYEPRYLTQVSSQLLKLMDIEKQLANSKGQGNHKLENINYKLFLCNVDFNPSLHKEFIYLASFLPTFRRYTGNESLEKPGFHETFEKEKEDYVYCLRRSLHVQTADGSQPDYVLLVEDDAYPHANLFPVLKHFIHSHLENIHKGHSLTKSKKSVAYIKLYHPKRLQSYLSLQPDRLPELLGIGMLFGTFLTLLYSRIRPRAYSVAVNRHSKLCFLLFVIYCGMVAFAIGRQNIMGLRHFSKHLYSYVPAPECCTPAMLFPRDNARCIIKELSNVRCRRGFAKDDALEHIMHQSNLSAFMVSPGLFEHIGMYSMLRRGKLIDPAILP